MPFASAIELGESIAPSRVPASRTRPIGRAGGAVDQLPPLEFRERVRSLVRQIRIGDAQVSVWLDRTALVSSLIPGAAPEPAECIGALEPLVLSINASLRRAGKEVRLVIGDGAAQKIDDGLLSLIARDA